MNYPFAINYRVAGSGTLVLNCISRAEADLYAEIIREDGSIDKALLIERRGLFGVCIAHIK